MSQPERERDVSGLPSEHFELADEYWGLEAIEAKVRLQERTKELGAITRANELFGEGKGQIKDRIATYVNELPAWFQYPTVTEAQITVGTTTVETDGFHRTSYPLSKEVSTEYGTRVVIETVYTEDRPEEDDGPWLDEEHDLLETIVGFIKNYQNRTESSSNIEQQFDQQQNVARRVETGVRQVRKNAVDMKEGVSALLKMRYGGRIIVSQRSF